MATVSPSAQVTDVTDTLSETNTSPDALITPGAQTDDVTDTLSETVSQTGGGGGGGGGSAILLGAMI